MAILAVLVPVCIHFVLSDIINQAVAENEIFEVAAGDYCSMMLSGYVEKVMKEIRAAETASMATSA